MYDNKIYLCIYTIFVKGEYFAGNKIPNTIASKDDTLMPFSFDFILNICLDMSLFHVRVC